MEFLILGPLEVRVGEMPLVLAGGRQRALLALLLLNANRVVAVERLIDDLWGDEVPETAPKAVQIFVSKLRKVLPEGRLKTRPPGYLIELSQGELDLERFERLLADGRGALARGKPQDAASLLREALSLWRGPALAEFAEPFAQPESARLEELRLACLEERIEADLALGGHAGLVGELEALVARHPLRERLRAQHMLALYRSGRHAEALSAYQEFRRLLDEELGIEPPQRLRELERRILQQDPELDAPAAAFPTRGVEATRRAAPVARVVETRVSPPGRLLVGREAELARLDSLLGEALAGERRVVFITGEAGAGKTTLVESFLGQATGANGFLLAHGQCLEQHGAGEPYMPVLEALGRLCREPGGEQLVALLTRRAPTWLAHMPWLLRPEELEALQSRTLGATRDRMLREMLETLEELTRERPLVLVLEDLHWSDPSTIDLLEAAARRPDSARLLVLGTFRPESGAAGHPLYGVAANLRLRGFAEDLSLGMLPTHAVREFLALRCPGGELPARLGEVLHERTGGNPLFMEKVVDSWLAQGSLREENGTWLVATQIDALAVGVPDTLRELIEQRLSEVGEESRQLLEAASATGVEFSAALVAAACERDADEVEAQLAELTRRTVFVEARGEEEWPDRTVVGRFAFVHYLYQEVLYDLLPAGRRTRLHERVGVRLERAYGDRAGEIAPELAFHFVRGRDAERAVRHLHEAAQQALGRSAPREAIEHLLTGLGLLESLPGGAERDRWELVLQATLGPVEIAAKGWAAPEAEAALLRARELAAELGRVEEGSRVLFNLGTLYEVRAEYERSDPLLEESLRLAGRPAPPPALVDSNELLACSLFHQGAFGRALGHAEVGLSHFDGFYANPFTAAYGDHAGSGCHSWAALALWFLGHPDQALRRAHQAVTLATDPRAAHGLATAQVQAAVVSQCRGEPDATLEWADAAVASAETRGFRYRAAMGRILRGWALAAQGTTDAGIDELRGGLELARATGARMDAPYFLGLLADACARDGRHEEALAALDQALELVRRSRTYFFEAELHRLRGDVLLHTGRRDDGEASLERALEAAQRQGSPALELRAAVSLGQLRREQGRGAEAASIVGAAHAKFTEGFDTPDLVQGRALLEELEAPVPGPPSLPGSTEVTQPRAEPASPPVRYARSGDLNIAYQVIGDGRIDLVLVHGWVCSFQPGWENPKIARFYRRLASLGRLVLFDKRGTGLSDRVPSDRLPDLETRMDDVRAVMDAAGSERAIVIGISEGGAMSALFAATHPERVAGLVLLGTFARRMWAPDYPFGPTEEEWQAQQTPPDAEDWASAVTRRWLERTSPGIVRDEAAFRWYASYVTRGASPGAQEALARMNKDLDIRHVLPAIRVPTLVLYRSHEWYRDATRYMAERIQGAETVELPGADHIPWEGDQDALLDRIAAFVSRSAGAAPADGRRVLATILVADLVGSTETAARLGDRAWTELLARHERTVKEVLVRFSGEVVDMAGDGVLALFDGPSRAIRAALTLRRELAQLDLPVRVGIHTGEIERVGHRPRGIAVHLAARVAGEAGPGEVLVTATTRDLVAGSGLAFSDRGERLLRGFDEPRRLHEAVA